jgi:hypothetical protein
VVFFFVLLLFCSGVDFDSALDWIWSFCWWVEGSFLCVLGFLPVDFGLCPFWGGGEGRGRRKNVPDGMGWNARALGGET